MSKETNGLRAWLDLFEIDIDDLPAVGVNSDDETILIELVNMDGEQVIKWTTCQSNGWERINYYWSDGTVEELYKHAEQDQNGGKQ